MRVRRMEGPRGPVVKFELLTQKDVAEYERTKSGLLKVLEKLGGYEPAVDDIHIDQIARNLIYLNKVEFYLDSEHSTEDTYAVVADSKLKLMKMIDNAIRELALSRRDRLDKQSEAGLERTMREEFLRVMKLPGE